MPYLRTGLHPYGLRHIRNLYSTSGSVLGHRASPQSQLQMIWNFDAPRGCPAGRGPFFPVCVLGSTRTGCATSAAYIRHRGVCWHFVFPAITTPDEAKLRCLPALHKASADIATRSELPSPLRAVAKPLTGCAASTLSGYGCIHKRLSPLFVVHLHCERSRCSSCTSTTCVAAAHRAPTLRASLLLVVRFRCVRARCALPLRASPLLDVHFHCVRRCGSLCAFTACVAAARRAPPLRASLLLGMHLHRARRRCSSCTSTACVALCSRAPHIDYAACVVTRAPNGT